ncbi:unnamed protein product [Didymodactylos carnosus]|uniref:Uncharacterized protein n=1 Tax=Didymodactylos carnosus TaxID=1234261 RepID=A0A815VP15_9BILA|nr:unnamed protein product [Didymodactylos carnosus]CAF1534737.1 unnamed protein product [Didymodactylos carnosus]CAF4242757.1 unnamed protein product [Didymodactylos carnosus]CAF4394425.1 unnamed protein product [Didymodactylos carnosus]
MEMKQMKQIVQKAGPCRTQYTMCDMHWDCLNGEDEVNCTKYRDMFGKPFNTKCNINQHYCVQSHTGEYGCLSSIDKANDVIDCLGSTDERQYCIGLYPSQPERYYRCWNSTQCITIQQVCDCHKHCLPDDDDELVCPWMKCGDPEEIRFECIDGTLTKRALRCEGVSCPFSEDKILCDLISRPRRKAILFDTESFLEYPQSSLLLKQSEIKAIIK